MAGIALTAIYAPNGPLGALAAKVGIKTAYSPLGIFIALVFIGLPFVVPLAAAGAAGPRPRGGGGGPDPGRQRPAAGVRVVILPALAPALISGVSLAFARAVGEYGSVMFIAGNMPMKTEIAPLLIVIKLEQYDYAGAAAVGLAMVVISFGALLVDQRRCRSAWPDGARA